MRSRVICSAFSLLMNYLKGTVLLFVLFCSKAISQPITFQKVYYPNPLYGILIPFEIIQLPGNGYLTGNGHAILKTDSAGNEQWAKDYDAIFYCFNKTYDGGYITTGYDKLLKFDSSVSLTWSRSLTNLNNNAVFYTILETADHGFILGGGIFYLQQPDARFLIVKTDSTGNVTWSKVFDA